MHCGWNSTVEALSLGVPIVALLQWTNQSTNAMYIMDVWKIGIKAVADEKGVVRQEVRKTLEWKELVRKAVDEGGSSSKTVDEFIKNVVQQRKIVLAEI
ncbi:UDP-glycosyltransferase 74E2-like [Pyrus ussuriensis x Pyrus communis]|uniref:UDP-glycosyltransferase 74E2-like n=1 Tax=Pyrus ussuriensis x Pyrus communis TaxID=2448454 RepID=A0A5N5GPY8_9ROSA|nr:UDP-glycosyltransferase 74E2-like [Pyrus ussuriensis x Pyrus communis]